MAGGIVFALAMVLVVPVGVMLAGALWSAIVGWSASEPPSGQPVGSERVWPKR